MPIEMRKNGIDSSQLWSERFVRQMGKNIETCKKEPFLSLFFFKKKWKISEINNFFLKNFWIKKNKSFKYDGQQLVNILDHTNMPNYH